MNKQRNSTQLCSLVILCTFLLFTCIRVAIPTQDELAEFAASSTLPNIAIIQVTNQRELIASNAISNVQSSGASIDEISLSRTQHSIMPTTSANLARTLNPTPKVEKIEEVEQVVEAADPVEITTLENSSVLTARSGVNYNDNGNKETYYNLNMDGVVRIMRDQGYTEALYPYWVRE